MSKVLVGARVAFYLNNTKVAYASNVSYNETIAAEDVNVLDQINPAEIAETGYTIDFSCTHFTREDKNIKDLGIMPSFDNILKAGVLTAAITDSLGADGGTGAKKNVILVTGAKCLGRSGNSDARGILTETWNFRGLKEES